MSKGKPVFSDGQVHLMPDKCSTCIFRPGNLMRLEPGRVKEMVDGAVRAGSVIPCHKTIHGERDQEAICRGYFDAYNWMVPALNLAVVMGMITEVEPG